MIFVSAMAASEGNVNLNDNSRLFSVSRWNRDSTVIVCLFRILSMGITAIFRANLTKQIGVTNPFSASKAIVHFDEKWLPSSMGLRVF